MGRYLAGVGLLCVMSGGAGLGAVGLRRAWLRGWSGAPARLAEAVLALALLLGVAYVMGSVGAFRPWAVGGAVLAVGLVAWAPAHILGAGRFGRRVRARSASAPVNPPAGRGALAVAAVVSAWLLAQWWAFTAPALEHGMGNIDTLWYHAPFAARFVQEGWITRLVPTHPGLIPTFYPDNSELVHALAILPFHRDVLAPLLNLGWLLLAALAGWCVGRPYGAPAGTLLAATIPLGTPVLASTQPGNATNDVVVLALFMAALALVTNAKGERAPLALSCVAAGLAAGTKVTMVAPAIAVALCAPWLAARGARRSAAAWCALGVIVFGGFWYLRNAVRAGSPVPPVHLHLGPISFPTPAGLHTPPALNLTFAGLATRNDAWGSVILPGLRENLGVAWWAILALAALGTLISLIPVRRMGNRWDRLVVAVVALVAAVAYAFTPGTGALEYTVRYAFPEIAGGLALAALQASRVRRWSRWWGVVVLGALFLATELSAGAWPHADWLAAVAVGTSALAVCGALIALPGRRARRRAAGALTVIAVAVAVGLGWPLQQQQLSGRYAQAAIVPGALFQYEPRPLVRLFDWARRLHGVRVGIVGFYLQYPLYGTDLSNRVQYVGHPAAHGGWLPILGCRAWRQAVDVGRYRFVVTAPDGFPFSGAQGSAPENAWMRSAPGIRELHLQTAPVAVFSVQSRLPSTGCRSRSR